jgi:tetratricopeptide (TPR) repeat protein
MRPPVRSARCVPATVVGIALAACGFPSSGTIDAGQARPGPATIASATGAAPTMAASRYGFGDASEEALAAYRRGWRAILRDGRWTEAERLYREALTLDPEFTIARSVLARITLDSAERDALYRQVERERQAVDPMGQLLLHTYQKTLELFARREAGTAPGGEERRAMAERAAQDYRGFLLRYPDEWSVMIEYVEWVHALDGPEAALATIDRLRAARGTAIDFSYFPAWFHAELGELGTARRLAAAFRDQVADPDAPQPYFLEAYLHFEAGDLRAAAESVERALALDPRHLLAARLRDRIDASSRGPD